MKVTVITPPEVRKEVPPLTLQVTFQTEDEMQRYRRIHGSLSVDDVHYLVFQQIGEHLEKYTGKRDNRR